MKSLPIEVLNDGAIIVLQYLKEGNWVILLSFNLHWQFQGESEGVKHPALFM